MSEYKVREFFERRVDKFDSIYAPEKKTLWKILDFLFRRSMQKRFELALKELKDSAGKKILDIGCGSGRYSVALSEMGAMVVGIDFAGHMVNLAQAAAQEKQVDSLCSFIAGDFMDYQFIDTFDISLAIGFFDYIAQPLNYLQKIKSLTKEKAIISFPAKWRLRNLVRRLRLKALGCPVYFYSKSDIENILDKSGFKDFSIKDIGRDYFVVIEIKGG